MSFLKFEFSRKSLHQNIVIALQNVILEFEFSRYFEKYVSLDLKIHTSSTLETALIN